MALMKAEWLKRGYFEVGNEGLMPAVRDDLERRIQLSTGHLSVRFFPVRARWKHTYWWREGKDAYAEAQFFAQVARAYPVLSLGAAVEKGFTTAPEGVVVPREEMMTGEWDWHRVVPELDAILKEDVPAIADRLGDITLRIRVSTEGNDPTTGKPKRLWRWKAFTYSDRKWYKRYVGNVEVEPITAYVQAVHAKPDVWAILHLAHDLSPEAADDMTATVLADKLAQFDGVRRRLRGLPQR